MNIFLSEHIPCPGTKGLPAIGSQYFLNLNTDIFIADICQHIFPPKAVMSLKVETSHT
jgi:hypothetical protein